MRVRVDISEAIKGQDKKSLFKKTLTERPISAGGHHTPTIWVPMESLYKVGFNFEWALRIPVHPVLEIRKNRFLPTLTIDAFRFLVLYSTLEPGLESI